MGSWSIAGHPHVFTESGREAVITDSPNTYALFSDPELEPHMEAYLAGTLTDPVALRQVVSGIVRLTMVAPRVARDGEPLPDDQDPEDPKVIPLAALHESEVDELVELFAQAIRRADTFRSGRNGDGGGEGGAAVGAEPKRKPRPRTRKPGGGTG